MIPVWNDVNEFSKRGRELGPGHDDIMERAGQRAALESPHGVKRSAPAPEFPPSPAKRPLEDLGAQWGNMTMASDDVYAPGSKRPLATAPDEAVSWEGFKRCRPVLWENEPAAPPPAGAAAPPPLPGAAPSDGSRKRTISDLYDVPWVHREMQLPARPVLSKGQRALMLLEQAHGPSLATMSEQQIRSEVARAASNAASMKSLTRGVPKTVWPYADAQSAIVVWRDPRKLMPAPPHPPMIMGPRIEVLDSDDDDNDADGGAMELDLRGNDAGFGTGGGAYGGASTDDGELEPMDWE